MRAETGPEVYSYESFVMAIFIVLGGNSVPQERLEKEEKTDEDMTILSGELCYLVSKRE